MSDVTTTISSPSPSAIDVSDLPDYAFDWRDPVWWGNTLLIVIETVTISLTLVAYFYIRRNFNVFPPPKIDVHPPVYNTAPHLLHATVNLGLMVLSCIPMWITDRYARRLQRGPVIVGLAVMAVVGIVCCWLRWYEFRDVIFRWNDNAYASVVWFALGTHATYLLAATIEFLVMLSWVIVHELDGHHGLDVTLCGGYWYWTAAVFVAVYAVIYLSPRLT